MLAVALISTSHNALLLLGLVTLASPSHAPRSRFTASGSASRWVLSSIQCGFISTLRSSTRRSTDYYHSEHLEWPNPRKMQVLSPLRYLAGQQGYSGADSPIRQAPMTKPNEERRGGLFDQTLARFDQPFAPGVRLSHLPGLLLPAPQFSSGRSTVVRQ